MQKQFLENSTRGEHFKTTNFGVCKIVNSIEIFFTYFYRFNIKHVTSLTSGVLLAYLVYRGLLLAYLTSGVLQRRELSIEPFIWCEMLMYMY